MNKLALALFVIFSVLVSSGFASADANVHINPDPGHAKDTLTCYVTYNPNNPAAYDYTWYINGQHASDLDNYYQVPSNYPKIKGETFRCDVKQDLGYYGGIIAIGSHTISIVNTAPVMDTLSQTSNSCISGGRSVTVSFSGHDNDNDAITYTVSWGDSSANTVTTSTSATHVYAAAGGSFTVTVTANDGQAASNVLTLVLNLAPCAGPGQTFANITLDSQQNNLITQHLPTVIFNGTSYTVLPATLNNFPTQAYAVSYTPQPGFAFMNWVATGGITVLSATSVNVAGNGNLTAIYQDIQAPNATLTTPANGAIVNVNCTTNTANITFNVNITDNAGNIAPNIVSANLNLNGTVYPMTYVSGITWTATVTGLTAGTYPYNVTATDASGNSFTTPTQTLTISNANCQGGGTVYNIVLDSKDIIPGATPSLGSMTFNSTAYGTLPTSVLNYTAGTYAISYAPVSGFGFDHWESNVTSGSITFGNLFTASTTATVGGSGTIYAVYKNLSVNYTITLQSEHLTNTSITNLGSIVFGTTSYTLANSLSTTAGTYSIDFTGLPTNYTFDHWSTIGSISVASSTSKQTTAVVTGAGTLKAVFKDMVAVAPVVTNIEPSSGTGFTVKCSDNKADVKIKAIVTDGDGLQSVKAEINGTNYTMSSSGSTYSVTVQLAAGTYSYKIFAKDSTGQETVTTARSFTVDGSTCEGGEDSLLVYAQLANDEKAKPGEQTYVLVKLYNTGTVDISDLKVKAVIQDFAFTRTLGPFKASPGWTSKIIYFDVPEDAKGKYDVQINVFNNDLNRVKFRELTVVGAELPAEDQPVVEPIVAPQEPAKKESILPLLLAFIIALILLVVALTFAVRLVYESKEL